MGGSWLSLVQMRKRNASQLTVELAGPWLRQHLSPPVSTLNPQPQAQTPGLLKLSVPTPLPDMQRFTRSSDGREQPNLGTSPCPRSYPVMTWRKVIHARKRPADTSPEEHSLYVLAQALELATSLPEFPVQHISECPACLSNGEAKGRKRQFKLNCLSVPIRKTLL